MPVPTPMTMFSPATARSHFRAALCWVLAAAPALCLGADIGNLGPTYPVQEQNLLAMIEQRLLARAESGEMTRLMEQAAATARATVASPAPVAGLTACSKARSFYFDPSMVLAENVFDGTGRLMFAAGTRKNPLDVITLSHALLFFDARDARQRGQAQRMLREHGSRLKLILTGGSYLDLMRQWRMPIYYDQQGLLTRRLGIRQVPALVTQEGLRLRIDEMEVSP